MMMKHIFARAAMLLLVLSLAVPGLALAETADRTEADSMEQ